MSHAKTRRREDAMRARRIHPLAAPREAGAPHSKTACAWIWVMTKGMEFVEEGLQKYKAQELARLERWAKKDNIAVVPIPATEGST